MRIIHSWLPGVAGICLAACSSLFAGTSSGSGLPCSVTNRNGQISVKATDCPLRELLVALCGQIRCELYFDPQMTDRVSVAFDDLDSDQALFRALNAFDYVITWEKGRPVGDPRHDRITSIRVFRDSRPEGAVWMSTSDQVDMEPDILALGNRLAVKTDPEDARQAAASLVRNGSPAAFKALFAALPFWNDDGALTDPVSRVALSVTEKGAAPGLLMEYLAATDESVILATRFDLSRIADSVLVKTLGCLYGQSDDPVQKERLEALIGSISSQEAEDGLIGLAGSSGRSEGPLQWAALKALGNMGTATATDHLLARLEKGRVDERDELSEIVQNVSATSSSAAALRYAALGNKRFSSEFTRLAALEGLSRLMDGESLDVLKKLTHDPCKAIRLAALQKVEQHEQID